MVKNSPNHEQNVLQARFGQEKLGILLKFGFFFAGWTTAQSNIDASGRRADTGTVLLLPAMQRPNLHVLTSALVAKVRAFYITW